MCVCVCEYFKITTFRCHLLQLSYLNFCFAWGHVFVKNLSDHVSFINRCHELLIPISGTQLTLDNLKVAF